ncbi:MAG: acetyl-CoA decarbonylase/synthase complex subunit gamma [Desulfobacterota bacterium]|nr:acetyl-CoA decarbonylase/synthase complex subunit gamma [Thermodesulfobacteriota bacterium]MDW8002460.1 acetyl-CoA decarbonylase/synthase complex subunit gamma [Deltaproteobacteria bacterium]
MPASGSEIVKLLPGRKPCKDCGFPTCFAFAMKLATGGVTPDKCPHLSEEAKAKLEDMLAPAIKLVTIGTGENKVEVGNEEVIYRHEKTYLHPPGIGILVSDLEPEGKIEEKVRKVSDFKFPWVGLTLKAEMVALFNESKERERFLNLCKKVASLTDKALIVISEDVDTLFAARDLLYERRPLLYPIDKEKIEIAIPKLKEKPVPVGVRANSVEELIPLTKKLKEYGVDDALLDPGSMDVLGAIRDQTFIRRAAIKQGFRPLGYPTIAFPCFMAKDGGLEEILIASVFVVKFASVIVLSDFDEHTLLPLLVQRLNIYTDPRFPMAVEEKYYEIGEPDEYSPVLVTSNWALTYFIVSSAIEATKVPSFLCVKDTDGLGVLTGWAAGKFTGDSVASMIKKSGIEARVRHRKLVIPGRVARIKGELEDALPGWEVVVGPREATGIGAFLPEFAKTLRK